jgi:hypothetical protein
MKAIVLTCDKYSTFCSHMIHTYDMNWPDNGFTFIVPYQSTEIGEEYRLRFGSRVNLIQTDPGIRDTMDRLLSTVDDNEWIYWCMDDRYLISCNSSALTEFKSSIQNCSDFSICGFKFITRLEAQLPEHVDYSCHTQISHAGHAFNLRRDFLMIWIHQFIRAKVLKFVFLHVPHDLQSPKLMDGIVEKLNLPWDFKLYTAQISYCILGESTTRGYITSNCAQSLISNGFPMPAGFLRSKMRIITGNSPSFIILWCFYIRKTIKFFLFLVRNVRVTARL